MSTPRYHPACAAPQGTRAPLGRIR